MALSVYAIKAQQWFNCKQAPTETELGGKVVVVEAFQMLCPGCVHHGLPQALRIRETFRADDVAVIGLHSVFEHHAVMTPAALEVFLSEFRIGFPVAVDQPVEPVGMRPETMRDWQLEGTPTLLLFDHTGRMRARHFGQVSDLAVGAEIMALIKERDAALAAAD